MNGEKETLSFQPQRYVSSVPRHAAPPDAFTGESLNWEFDPTEQKASARKGTATFNGSGISELVTTPRVRQVMELHPAQVSTGYGTVAVHQTLEATKSGSFVVRDPDLAIWYTLGSDFSNYYAVSTSAAPKFVWTPLWCNNVTTPISRGQSSTERGRMFAGGRRLLEVGDWLYSPNEHGTPWMWSRAWNNPSAGGGTNINRLRPWGQYPPLWPPDVDVSAAPTGTAANPGPWSYGDLFFNSLVFEFEDGSLSPPVIPRDRQPSGTGGPLASGFGRVYFATGAAGTTYQYALWRYIARGPFGTRKRHLLRTPKVTTNSSTAVQTTAIRDMRVVATLENNTQTTYYDTGGNDTATLIADDSIRFDHKWPRRGRYVIGNDARVVVCGNLLVNPGAIIIAPTGVNATYDLNETSVAEPEQGLYSASIKFYLYVDSANNRIRLQIDRGGVVTQTDIASYKAMQLQEIVDRINDTTVASGGAQWRAQLVPGADHTALGSDLQKTDTFNIGDGAIDRIWCRDPFSPTVVYFNSAYLDRYPADTQALDFTSAGPRHTQSAARSFYVRNVRKPPERAYGRCMGGGAVNDRFVIYYERARCVLGYVRPTGEDDDYRLQVRNPRRGCCAWNSIVVGDGWVGAMTPDGYEITDGDRAVIISRDVWHRKKALGDWGTEITSSVKASNSDALDANDSYFTAALLGDQLHINYRKTATLAADRRLVYDFSVNSASSGLDALVDPQEGPFGWSCPLTNTLGAMCETRDSSGTRRLGALENVASGQVIEFDVGRTDIGAVAITATGYLTTRSALLREKVTAARAQYAKPSTGLSVTLYRDLARASSGTKAMPSSAAATFAIEPIDFSPNATTASYQKELLVSDDGSGATAPDVWRIELDVVGLNTER